ALHHLPGQVVNGILDPGVFRINQYRYISLMGSGTYISDPLFGSLKGRLLVGCQWFAGIHLLKQGEAAQSGWLEYRERNGLVMAGNTDGPDDFLRCRIEYLLFFLSFYGIIQ